MTRAEIETMLTNLAERKRYMEETSRLVREAAERIAKDREAMNDVLKRIDAALKERET